MIQVEQVERERAWETAVVSCTKITDGLGRGIDAGILDVVVGLRVLGINTTGSCEGHVDGGPLAPWVDIEAMVTIEEQTPFLLGSLSKSFIMFAIMQLVETGKLRLDDPVQVAFPWFSVADTATITIRHLLMHTSGLSRYVGRDLLSGWGNTSIEQSVCALSVLRFMHSPGTRFEYSNSNYLVLAAVIEAVFGLLCPSYIERFIFGPLSMHESIAVPVVPGLAQGYCWWFGWPVAFDVPYLLDAQGAAFLISSASDMACWLLLHLEGVVDGVRLVFSAGMDVLHTPSVSIRRRGSSMTMGWRVESLAGESLLRHGGEVSNFRSDMIVVPGCRLGVVVLANCNNGLVAQLGLDQIAANVLRLLLGLPVPIKRLTFSRFYLGLAVVLALFTFLQVRVWPFLAFSGGPIVALVVVLAFGLLWPFLVFFRLPRAVDMPWRSHTSA